MTAPKEPMPSPAELPARSIDAIEELAGSHPGQRRAHARGICARGVFTPSGEAARLTGAAHLQREPSDVVVRFSNSASDPATRDLLSPAKGMAVQFQRPDSAGVKPVIVAVTASVFVARTPESFLEMMLAARDLARDGLSVKERLKSLLGSFPHAGEALTILSELKPPASFASVPYHSIHAFYLVDGEGRKQPVKYEWIPDAEVAYLPLLKTAVASKDYLEDELRERLEKLPAGFTLRIALGEPWDPVDDSSARWPADRPTLDIGHLSITELTDEPAGLLMDPTATGQGIEITPDPILSFRREAYAVSHERRMQGI
ncbi:catalase [Paenibacillus sp. B01]|uniref:catalase n=1 Tax=Paenibacillus sp. B01 TaxID=2660554 RepID=UPI00129A406D|nr:catalase [Paenibacillus sp. B01]QGG55124.1 catalase [Paenibacillus sp. B01]